MLWLLVRQVRRHAISIVLSLLCILEVWKFNTSYAEHVWRPCLFRLFPFVRLFFLDLGILLDVSRQLLLKNRQSSLKEEGVGCVRLICRPISSRDLFCRRFRHLFSKCRLSPHSSS